MIVASKLAIAFAISAHLQTCLSFIPSSSFNRNIPSATVNDAFGQTTSSLLRMGTDSYRKEFLDPKMWNKAPIIDWDKFYAQDPDGKMLKVYDPPQRYGRDLVMKNGSPAYDGLDWYGSLAPKLTPEEIVSLPKPNTAEITGDLFEKVLGPAPDSTKIPEPFRNALLWMDGNHLYESVLSFNRCAWRSQTEGHGRVIGLGCFQYDWANDPIQRAKGSIDKTPACWHSWQQSPCKKWYKGYVFVAPRGNPFFKLIKPKIFISWITVYVVQEGDQFVDRFGEPLSFIKPGDCIRITHNGDDGKDPYDCSPANVALMYLFRRVATYDEETGEVKRNSPHYEDLLERVAASPPENLTSFEYCTSQERFDIVTSTQLDTQVYMSAPVPPTGDVIENL